MAPRNLPGQNQRVSASLIGRRNRIARIPVTRFLKSNKLVPNLKHSPNGAGTASGKARVRGRGRPSVKAKNLQVEKRITQKLKSQADNISNSRNYAKEFALKLRGSMEYQNLLRTRKAMPDRRVKSLLKMYISQDDAEKRFRMEQLRLSRVLDDHDSDDDSVNYSVYHSDDDSDDDSLYDDNPNDDPDYALDDDQLFEHMADLLELEAALEEYSESPVTMTREST